MLPKLFCAFLCSNDPLAKEKGWRSSQNQVQTVLSSNLNPETFCFDFAAAAASEILATFNDNGGDRQGVCPTSTAAEEARGDCVMLATSFCTSFELLTLTAGGGKGKGQSSASSSSLCLVLALM
jgi:hypothetical protein